MYSKLTESQVTHRNVLLVRNRHSTVAELRRYGWHVPMSLSCYVNGQEHPLPQIVVS
jgi:hypothetical protein